MKNFILIFFIIVIYIFIGSVISDNVVIPSEAIRFRVVANSDSDYDQSIKEKISKDVTLELYNILEGANSIEDVRNSISSNINDIEKVLNKYNVNYDINYGLNYFPDKLYKGVKYEAGFYESLLITLGKGSGKNWWCVLFPPLCLLEGNESDDYEYKVFVKDLIDRFTK